MKKSNKILAVVLALVMMLTAVPMMTAGAAADHVHAFKQTAEVKAKCETETNGSVTYACSCGANYTIETNKFAHKLVGSIKQLDAVNHKQRCDTCEKDIPINHTFVDVEVIKAATCKEVGSKKVKCSACNYEKTVTIDKIAHTCTYVVDGNNHKAVCTVCAASINEAHDFGEAGTGTVKTAPKCDATGVEVRKCTKCTATKEYTLPKTHKFPAKATSVNGNTHKYTCAIETCGHVFTATELANLDKTAAHDFVVVVGEKSKCDDSVALTVTCKDCNYKLEAKATQHKFGGIEKYDENSHKQTCQNTGCNLTVTAPHVWKDVKEIEAATCGKVGSKEVKCNLCAEEATVEIPKLTEHTWGDWEVTKQPGFLTKGEETRKCDVCEKTETRKIDEIEEKVGDVNGNGKVEAVDARMILQHVAKTRELSAAELKRADIVGNGDGVKATDARKVLQIVAGL